MNYLDCKNNLDLIKCPNKSNKKLKEKNPPKGLKNLFLNKRKQSRKEFTHKLTHSSM